MATLKTHRRYSDINLLFSRHPTTGDVTKKTDTEAIKASVRNIILTKNYERPFHPEIGCQVHSLLFENVTPVTLQVMQRTIAQALEKFEPRVTLDNLVIDPDIDNNGIRVDVYFTINNTQEPVVISTTLTRIR